jgi:hypothetical protein
MPVQEIPTAEATLEGHGTRWRARQWAARVHTTEALAAAFMAAVASGNSVGLRGTAPSGHRAL